MTMNLHNNVSDYVIRYHMKNSYLKLYFYNASVSLAQLNALFFLYIKDFIFHL